MNRDTKLVTAKRRRNYFLSETNHHTAKFLTDIYKDIAEDVENRPFPKEKNKKVIGLLKYEQNLLN